MRFGSGALGAVSFVLLSSLAAPALAVGQDEASGTAKGTVGGALLGAELVLVVEAAFDVQPTWAYIAGGVGGALVGGYVGHKIEQDQSPRISMLLLASGLTLAIPTTVAVLSATAYEPPANYTQDTVPPDEPVADPPQSGFRDPKKNETRTRLRLTPPALLDIDPERVVLAIPAVAVYDVYTPTELFAYGTKQAMGVRVPVLSVAF